VADGVSASKGSVDVKVCPRVEPIESTVRTGDVSQVDAGRVDVATRPVREWVAAVDGADALDRYPAEAAAVARDLMAGGVGASVTCRALTGLHDALTRRLIDLAAAELGPPPCPYAWLAIGSGGRMEQSLSTDQDNAIVYADELAPAGYFHALGTRVIAGLARAGLRRCPGGYMADRWHLPLARYRELFHRWMDVPEPPALVEAELFMDFRRVSGELNPEPLDAVLRNGPRAQQFLVGMARAAVRFPPPLRFTGRIRDEHGELDLKRGGLAGVVLLARLYALSAGSLARSTSDRLAEACSAGTISREGAAALTEAYRLLTELRLAAQLRQVAAGAEPTNRVRLADLSADERNRLRRALRSVRQMQRATEQRFHTHTVL
jgi:CBS domain-containing protein